MKYISLTMALLALVALYIVSWACKDASTHEIHKTGTIIKKVRILVNKAEAISMSDRILVLSRRPASVKSFHKINLITEGEKTPLKVRKVPQFQDYFDILWKELDSYEIKK